MNSAFTNNPHWPETVTSILSALTDTFRTKGINAEESQQLAEAATWRLVNDFGGMQMYLPTGSAAKRSIRDAIIYRQAQTKQFTTNELAQQFKLSSKQINEILRNQTEQHAKRP
ncbi:MAG: Mor transcription activator family protein [Thiolinea sp.]